MKSKLNLFLLISFLIALTLTIWLNYQVTNRIGDLAFNKEIDNSTFKVCDEERITQYYATNSNYQGGKKAIKKELKKTTEQLTFKNSGFVTFRFIINCKGKIGRFRVKTIDSELIENNFEIQKIKTLQTSIENLTKWNAGTWKDKTFDSYYVLNFKIEQGKITDIF
ncbi:MAG: hypothetical protein COB12_09450 [Flavobacterium sp.]|nr:MAG: hypothetical protein COB12_09450 [Flavobacterium sp.]